MPVFPGAVVPQHGRNGTGLHGEPCVAPRQSPVCAGAEASACGSDGHRSVPERSRSDPTHRGVSRDAKVDKCFNGSPPFVAQQHRCRAHAARSPRFPQPRAMQPRRNTGFSAGGLRQESARQSRADSWRKRCMHGSPKPPPSVGSSQKDHTTQPSSRRRAPAWATRALRPSDWSLPPGGRLEGAVEHAGAPSRRVYRPGTWVTPV